MGSSHSPPELPPKIRGLHPREPLATSTLVLHVGIHKTASTYIQKRLKSNQPFLRRVGLLYPKRRRDHCRLAQALRNGDLTPWDRLLAQAARKGCRPLVSAEILSLVLARPSRSAPGSVLRAFLDALDERSTALELVAFVRDQPAYLNSRYTQLIKRLYFTSSFERYLMQTMRSEGESNCDFEDLFGEALACGRVRCTFLPFRSGDADPCERLLQAMGVSSCADLRPLEQRVNAQPGWQAVWIARRVARRLHNYHPSAWHSSACKVRIRKALERIALQQGWQAEPFQGLSDELLDRLEGRYGPSNERFAQRVWSCSWRDVFPRPTPGPGPRAPRTPAERRELATHARQLLVEGLAGETG